MGARKTAVRDGYEKKSMSTVKNYLSLIRFSHTIFAMPFAMIGFFLGVKEAPFSGAGQVARVFILVILCMVLARSAAMAFNRWLDVKFDALNPRTRLSGRLPRGIISKSSALRFCDRQLSRFFVVCTWFLNPFVFRLVVREKIWRSMLFSSYTKRFTPMCHLSIGVGAITGSYRSLSGGDGEVCVFALVIFFCCDLLGERVRHYLCLAGRGVRPVAAVIFDAVVVREDAGASGFCIPACAVRPVRRGCRGLWRFRVVVLGRGGGFYGHAHLSAYDCKAQ